MADAAPAASKEGEAPTMKVGAEVSPTTGAPAEEKASEAAAAPETPAGPGVASQRPDSVIVKLKAAANAPVLVEKKRKFKLPASNPLTVLRSLSSFFHTLLTTPAPYTESGQPC
eukprot:m.256776 g.256776  ORF g.256776 m.256776 type:complete len:114 (-) comp15953_c0_seq2:17494-17835(-)